MPQLQVPAQEDFSLAGYSDADEDVLNSTIQISLEAQQQQLIKWEKALHQTGLGVVAQLEQLHKSRNKSPDIDNILQTVEKVLKDRVQHLSTSKHQWSSIANQAIIKHLLYGGPYSVSEVEDL